MESLNVQTVTTQFNSMSSSMVSGPNFQVNVPSSTVMVAKPLSYKFRVAEYVKDGKVMKVNLQVATFEHDNYGTRQMREDFTDVERIQLPYVE